MTGPSLAEVLEDYVRRPNHRPNCGCRDCDAAAEECAAAVTAHLAAILADVETIEAVAEAIGRTWELITENDIAFDEAYARAAIAVIASRLGVQA